MKSFKKSGKKFRTSPPLSLNLNFAGATKKTRPSTQSGQSLIEYLIIVALVAIGSIGIVKSLGETVNVRFANITQALQHRDSNFTPTEVTNSQVKKRELDDFFKESPGFGAGGR